MTIVADPAPAFEPSELSTERLEEEICELASHLAVGECRWLLLIAEVPAARGVGSELGDAVACALVVVEVRAVDVGRPPPRDRGPPPPGATAHHRGVLSR